LRTCHVKRTPDKGSQIAFGMRLRELRQSKGLTQETLSYLADIELSTLNRIELAKAGTSLANIFAICEALKIHPKELFDFELPRAE
jgi:transcriptional regulator with XRE-family HTH domain